MATQTLATSQLLPSLLKNMRDSHDFVFVCSTSGLPDTAVSQIDVSFFCVCPLIDYKLRHNIVKVAVEITSRTRVISAAREKTTKPLFTVVIKSQQFERRSPSLNRSAFNPKFIFRRYSCLASREERLSRSE